MDTFVVFWYVIKWILETIIFDWRKLAQPRITMESSGIYETTEGGNPFPVFTSSNTGECSIKPPCTSIAPHPTQTGGPATRNTIYAPFPSQSNRGETSTAPDTQSVRRLSWPRGHNRRPTYRLGCDQEDDIAQEAVDLLQTLPESQRKDSPIVPGSARATPALSARARHRFREEESEDSSGGLYDEAVLYYNSLCNAHNGNREPERIAFLSRSYSALERNKRNNSVINKSPEYARTMNVAEYCTSKLHSKSCGSLTCPKFEKNKLSRSVKQVYPEHKSRKRKQLKRFRRWLFITAILLGIVLAITGIVVAFLVFAPFRMGSKYSL